MSLFSRFSLWLSKNPMQRSLYILVPVAHVALFGGFLFSKPPTKPIPSKKILVKTFSPPPTPSQVTTQVAQKKALPASPAKKAPPKPEKKVEKTIPAPIKKAPLPKKEKTIQVKKEKSPREDLLRELEERIAKIEVKNDRIALKPDLTIPSTLTLNSQAPLQAPPEFRAHETSFSNEDFISSLIGYLQGYLHLPDVGEVQVQLTLNKEGKIKNMKVTKAESEKNRKYLEEQLPKLSFPQIYLDGASSNSFLLTFCNKF